MCAVDARLFLSNNCSDRRSAISRYFIEDFQGRTSQRQTATANLGLLVEEDVNERELSGSQQSWEILMKAVVYTRYGPPDVLELKDVPKPIPKENEILIKNHATTVNRTDCGFRDPKPIVVRFVSGPFRPKRTILGSEFAG